MWVSIFAKMENLTAFDILFSVCGLIILSYLFSVLNRATRIPSVLLLLGTGILIRYLLGSAGISFYIPQAVTEILGTVGLIMILLGIMIFNFFTAGHIITLQSTAWFLGSIPVALVLSVAVCFGLMLLLVKNRVNVKFFLVFAVLVVIYVGGKSMHLPSLLTVMMFGLVINNWELMLWKPLKTQFSDEKVNDMAAFLKSITAE